MYRYKLRRLRMVWERVGSYTTDTSLCLTLSIKARIVFGCTKSLIQSLSLSFSFSPSLPPYLGFSFGTSLSTIITLAHPLHFLDSNPKSVVVVVVVVVVVYVRRRVECLSLSLPLVRLTCCKKCIQTA